ncbi:MAG: ABC transporter ATP-binding protein [Acidimicrobiia bacterium]|nr:ABC transporter ATP-binding protein [Acidimicrobiia bacterium]
MTATPGEPVLECSGISKSFGEHAAVTGLAFSVAPGETYGLLGPNGAGKTTTISMIAGLLEPDAGEIRLAGEPMNPDATHTKRLVGLVPQDLAIYPDLDAVENLEFFGQLQGMKGAELERRVAEVLDIIELTDRAQDRTEHYSGGMKRRLNIGVGLLHRPTLLILDEPTVGVDPQSRNAILDSVERLGEEGMAVLYTTHYMEEAERLCDRIGIVDQGKLIAEGTQADLIRIVGQRDRLTLTATGSLAATASALGELEAVDDAGVSGDEVVLIVDRAHDHLPRILEIAARTGSMVKSVNVDSADLESVFLKLTGRALRE